MKKNIIKKCVVVSFAFIIMFTALFFSGCTNFQRYNLVDMHFSTVTVSMYEYNYIEFDFDNGVYHLENKVKANSMVTKQDGNFSIDGNNKVILSNSSTGQNYLLCSGETRYFQNNCFYVSGYISGYGNCSMTFSK